MCGLLKEADTLHNNYEKEFIINYIQEYMKRLSAELKAAGFRVFISDNGEHGLYTDQEGERVVTFDAGCGVIKFHGNYETDNPGSTGTGWTLEDNRGYADMLTQNAPNWAVGRSKVHYSTLAEHLSVYGKCCGYTEV